MSLLNNDLRSIHVKFNLQLIDDKCTPIDIDFNKKLVYQIKFSMKWYV